MSGGLLRWLKGLGLGGGAVVAMIYVLFLAYSLPSHTKVHVTGTEVTRKDVEDADGTKRTEDVRYVMAEGLDGEPHMFRNEDTGWGWPPYFKFDSGDLAAQANNYSTNARGDVVLVKYYGFRIRMLSAFPNVISMRTVPPDYQPIPWTGIIVGIAHIVLIGMVVLLIRDVSDARSESR